ncbi:MAG: hypothetical protein PHR28_09230 [candidate division Zixibacteria bacterium]|jgi:hypothetical protein|nr:hypothetical protein [candidate division Zixibacteria bacterium]
MSQTIVIRVTVPETISEDDEEACTEAINLTLYNALEMYGCCVDSVAFETPTNC